MLYHNSWAYWIMICLWERHILLYIICEGSEGISWRCGYWIFNLKFRRWIEGSRKKCISSLYQDRYHSENDLISLTVWFINSYPAPKIMLHNPRMLSRHFCDQVEILLFNSLAREGMLTPPRDIWKPKGFLPCSSPCLLMIACHVKKRWSSSKYSTPTLGLFIWSSFENRTLPQWLILNSCKPKHETPANLPLALSDSPSSTPFQ